jgi:hypothetical protein
MALAIWFVGTIFHNRLRWAASNSFALESFGRTCMAFRQNQLPVHLQAAVVFFCAVLQQVIALLEQSFASLSFFLSWHAAAS